MNTNLTKYLSDVFRNEVKDKTAIESKELKSSIAPLKDSKLNHFLLDRKYALRLDEII
ncbi:hypothetical protein ICN18_06245 [Polynucleobacter sp. Ross1-W9]|uniref:hypothetical protein n=1 Tax=Polynucleobacter parvulilacunae TaxID=1855631 RepID=UPI001C0DE915|nr:hypothetical protein [Polynucleobacter parvulilacunae]MBU3557227.1 hypothetical protein [Polynucleobacter parvulilacunae]